MYELHRLSRDHLEAVLAFELENRTYFARYVTDRGDEFYETFSEHHDALLAEQDAGVCAFYVLVDRDGSIVGRFNLYDLNDGAANVGYRVAEEVTGRGVATEALRDLCRKAATDHGLRTVSGETSRANVASQRVLEKAGFATTGSCVIAGKPGLKSTLALAHEPT
jgi:[ribosomal protein S5]-alanine N-acetyltransferase